MATCGSCNSNRTVCACVFADSDNTQIVGNGSLMNPYGFDKTEGPTPRPLADIARHQDAASLTIPINTFTQVTFTLNQLIRDGVSLDTGMVNGSMTRITCNQAGKYLVGGFLLPNDLTTVVGNNRFDVYLSEGSPTASNVWASISTLRTAQNPNATDDTLCPQSFVQWSIGNYMEMWLFSTIADSLDGGPNGANAQMYAIWMDE